MCKSIKCMGIRGKDGDVLPNPMRGKNINFKKIVNESVVFYDSEYNLYYDILVKDYISGNISKFKVEYEDYEYIIYCDSLINKCQISNIINRKNKNEFYKEGDYWVLKIRVIGTSNEKYFKDGYAYVKFDGENTDYIINSAWYIIKKGNKFYVSETNYKLGCLHRIVYGKCNDNLVIDHINGDSLDNRVSNLREVYMSDNNKNKKGSGYPKKSYNMWNYSIMIEGTTVRTKSRITYDDADMDTLIIQEYYGYTHREDEFFKTKDVEDEYKKDVISYVSDKLKESKEKVSTFSKNKYEIVNIFNEECVKVYDKNSNFTYISKESLDILNLGRIKKSRDYWVLNINGSNFALHRYLLGIKHTNIQDIEVDHLNRNKYDNRLNNLIITTPRGNKSNKEGLGYSERSYNSYRVNYFCYWEYIKYNKYINSAKAPSFKTKDEAIREVEKRKMLCDLIRPKFNNYEEYLNFKKVNINVDIDTAWINKIKIKEICLDN